MRYKIEVSQFKRHSIGGKERTFAHTKMSARFSHVCVFLFCIQ